MRKAKKLQVPMHCAVIDGEPCSTVWRTLWRTLSPVGQIFFRYCKGFQCFDALLLWQGVKDRTSVATTELCWDTFFKGEQIGEQGGQR